jgi:hypothetical protein
MADKLYIFNEAARICSTSALQTVDETGETGLQLRNAWDGCVAYCFEQSGWQMAEKRAQLSRLVAAPEFGYAYFYQLPADCIRLLAVLESGVENDVTIRYKLEGGRIASDADTIYVRYLSHDKFDRPGQWSQTFADWVAAELASRVAPKLNPKSVEFAMGQAKKRKSEARNLDALQQPAKLHRMSSWARAPMSRGNREQGR